MATTSSARSARYEAQVAEILAPLFGCSEADVDRSSTFLELGADSLLLMRASRAIEQRFGVTIPFRTLMGGLGTVRDLAAHLTTNIPAETPAAELDVPLPEAPSVSPDPPRSSTWAAHGDRGGASDLERIVSDQLHLMSRQLELLRRARAGTHDRRQDQPSAAPTVEAAAAPDTATPEAFGPFRPASRQTISAMTDRQQRHLSDLVARYTARTAASKQFAAEHRRCLADPRAPAGFQLAWKEMVYPLVGSRSKGSRLWDLDGNQYVDFTMGFGVHLFGHSPPCVTNAIAAQLAEGLHLGPQTERAGRVAALLAELTGMERVAFCNSGTEAVMGAIRLARAATGRARIAVFSGAYHGTFDGVLGREQTVGGVRRTAPVSIGTPLSLVADVMVLDYGDPASIDAVRHAADLAAVLVEPVQSRNLSLQPRAFLEELRAVTAQVGAALIFDEIISGFRVHPRGCQGWFGVSADLATYGKVVAGGLPIGVIAGAAPFLDRIDGGSWQYGDRSCPTVPQAIFAGTFSKNPLTMAVAEAVLSAIREQSPELQESLNRRTGALAEALNAIFTRWRAAMQVHHFGSMFRFARRPDARWLDLLFYHLVDRGAYIWEGRGCFLSTAHGDADATFLVDAVDDSLRELEREGFLGERPLPAPASAPTHTFVPMAASARQIWVHSQISEQASLAYNELLCLRMHGEIDIDAMRQSVRQLAERHDALRATADESGERWCVAGEVAADVARIDLSERYAGEGEVAMAAVLDEAIGEPFDLTRGPLFRVRLYRLASDQHLFALVFHHLAMDGLSAQLFLQELRTMYVAAIERRPHALPPARQFSERAGAAPGLHSSADALHGERFWSELLDGAAPLHLPLDRPRPAIGVSDGRRERITTRGGLGAALADDAARANCSLFVVLLSAFVATLHRLSRQNDFVVGVTSMGRAFDGDQRMIGHCVDLLPLRSRAADDPELSGIFGAMKSQLLDAQQYAPWLHPSSGPRRLPAIRATFNMDPPARDAGSSLDFGSIHVTKLPGRVRHVKFDVQWNVAVVQDELSIVCDYNARCFDPSSIRSMLDTYVQICTLVARTAHVRLSELPPVTDVGRERLMAERAATARSVPHTTIPALFETQVRRTPHAVAVACGEERLTYAQLDERANRLAHHLIASGVGPERLVGVALPRSTNLVVAIVATLKAGGAYVPIEPDYPDARLAFMIEDARPSLVLTTAAMQPRLPPVAPTLDLDDEAVQDMLGRLPSAPPDLTVLPQHPTYVIYTSGSTGAPKGATNTHEALVNRLLWMQHAYGLNEGDRVLQKTPYGFDVSVWEFVWPLIVGAQVVVASPGAHRDPVAIADAICEHGVTTVHFVPSMLREFLRSPAAPRCVTLRRVICSGEALAGDLRQRFFDALPAVELHNLYGPTEAAIDVSAWACRPDEGHAAPPIGHAIWNTALYILDEHLQPVPDGVIGDLYIVGAGLARGYLRRPGLTADRFIPDPYADGARMYRTGDLARRRQGGALEFAGRRDDQIKLRGVRIEPGEIEVALRRHPAVRDAAVVPVASADGGSRLAAYVALDTRVAGTALRLAACEREGRLSADAWVELPNGLPVAHLTRGETEFLYDEIFARQRYLRHGVTLSPGACVLDVGANIGMFSLFVGHHYPGTRIYAFEPIAAIRKVLELNAGIHGLDVRVIGAGLAEEEGERTFTFYPRMSILSGQFADADQERAVVTAYARGHATGSADAFDELLDDRLAAENVRCRVTTISAALAEQRIERVDLLKIDAEKSELAVLDGLAADDWPKIRQVVVEVHDERAALPTIRARLQQHGFHVSEECDDSLAATGLTTLYAVREAGRESEVPPAPATWSSPARLIADMRARLGESLPEIMIPPVFVLLDRLPVSANGKLDRRALPLPDRGSLQAASLVPPRTPTEEVLAALWREVLGIDGFGVHANFFDLGGHSLLATRVTAGIRRHFHVQLRLHVVFDQPTIAQLAEVVETALLDALDAIPEEEAARLVG
ncbi:MAG: amino acid adenylation domain-containing protein [Vicinamibacterales bacterium]